jgi:hypothetical protein
MNPQNVSALRDWWPVIWPVALLVLQTIQALAMSNMKATLKILELKLQQELAEKTHALELELARVGGTKRTSTHTRRPQFAG